MAQPEFTPFVELLDKIAGFCAQGDTATIMLVSDDNRMAQIHLDNGRIVFVLCRGRRGRDGLDILRTIQNARMSLDRPSVGNNEPLPWSTEAILDYLYGSITELPEGSSPASTLLAGVARRPAAAPEAPSKPASNKPTLSQAQRTIFENTLATYIGPMAAIVCGDYFDEISDLRQLTLKLAGEIANADQAAKFKAEITQALGIRL
ncbi:hypothetical protein SAMN05518865_105249 [Duganella sp. CF458]|uniref:hypothetical protein n=1 Tax=Duganella sp. CF458 TaxID=1884368 RepID=UPI0008EEAFAA|nr:hypothetical protein [Duganella sp. CF458]SFF86651.1 hypothetical protein SAMN05518865_105249 [Duganella sp. CF458]